MISGKTRLIAHIGYPIDSFKAPLIYNPWFEKNGIDAVVVPMGVGAGDFPGVLASLRKVTNLHGALVTMPHKVTVVGLLDESSTTVKIAGSCNALLLRPDGTLVGDMFDGAGFARGLKRKGFVIAGASCLVVGTGGVGSAIAASLAAEGIASISLFDTHKASAEGLAARLREHYPQIAVDLRSNDPAGYDLVVNGTPLGMKPDDPLPMDVTRLSPVELRRRGRDEAGDHAAAARGQGPRLPLSGRDRHALRNDPGLPRVLRLRHRDTRRTAGGRSRLLLTATRCCTASSAGLAKNWRAC